MLLKRVGGVAGHFVGQPPAMWAALCRTPNDYLFASTTMIMCASRVPQIWSNMVCPTLIVVRLSVRCTRDGPLAFGALYHVRSDYTESVLVAVGRHRKHKFDHVGPQRCRVHRSRFHDV